MGSSAIRNCLQVCDLFARKYPSPFVPIWEVEEMEIMEQKLS